MFGASGIACAFRCVRSLFSSAKTAPAKPLFWVATTLCSTCGVALEWSKAAEMSSIKPLSQWDLIAILWLVRATERRIFVWVSAPPGPPVDEAGPTLNPHDLICSFRKSGDFEPTLSKISSILSADELHIEPTDKGWIRKIYGTSISQVEAEGTEHLPPIGLLAGFNFLRRLGIKLPERAQTAIDRHFGEIYFEQMLTTAPVAIAPVRSKPQRVYDPVSAEALTPEGGHIPFVLARMFRGEKEEWETLRKELVSFGKESQLFSDIAIRSSGKQSVDSFNLLIKARGPKANIMDVGYGVSQIIPLLVDTIRQGGALFCSSNRKCICTQKGKPRCEFADKSTRF